MINKNILLSFSSKVLFYLYMKNFIFYKYNLCVLINAKIIKLFFYIKVYLSKI